MKDISEIHESPDKQISKTLENKIDTFDDLKTSDKSKQVDTFDDIAKGHSSDKSIQTFDDIAKTKEGTIHQESSETSEKRTFENDTLEAIEQKRYSQAAEDIKNIDWMEPEKWKTLSFEIGRAHV